MAILVCKMCELDTEEMVDRTIEVYLQAGFGGKKSFEGCLHRWVRAEVYEIIYIDADVDGRFARNDGTGEDAGSIGARLEIDGH